MSERISVRQLSDALMAGLDVATVSRTSGKSISMMEKTYRHFRSDHLLEAQRRLDESRQKQRVPPASPPSSAAWSTIFPLRITPIPRFVRHPSERKGILALSSRAAIKANFNFDRFSSAEYTC
jgi:hypothetical protein